MQIVPLDSGHIDTLYQIYHGTTAQAAHSRFYPSLEHFSQTLSRPSVEGTRVLVAEVGGVAAGFAAVTPTAVNEDGIAEASITALFVEHEQSGSALLNACLLAAPDAQRVQAFAGTHERCPIPSHNGGWDALSDRMGLVGRVLVQAGFVPIYRELRLKCTAARLPHTPSPAPPEILIVERDDGPKRWSILATVDGKEIGVCMYNTLAPLTDHPDADRWGYIGWLHVDESLRRRGLARHLLTFALCRLQEHGCDGCWLTTGADNWPAQPLYLGLGFEIVDSSAGFQKTLRAN